MSEQVVINQHNLDNDVEAGVIIWTTPNRPIFRLPSNLRDDYKPRKISFGPYHHDNPSLVQEDVKRGCQDCFLKRCGKPLQFFEDGLSPMVGSFRNAYDQLDPKWRDNNNNSFLDLMILDGCFLLEILHEGAFFVIVGKSNDHPVFDPNEMDIYKHDMLLIENQIPLEVLVKLQSLANPRYNVCEMIYKFFEVPYSKAMLRETSIHILDVYRKGPYIGGPEETKVFDLYPLGTEDEILNFEVNYVPSATELHDASIGITKTRTTHFSLKHGTISLPPIYVDGVTKFAFRNAILFEQLYATVIASYFSSRDNLVSSYLFFMGNLVKGAEDVRLLRSRGIISTMLPDQEVADMFGSLCKVLNYAHLRSKSFWDFGKQVRQYYIKMSEPWRKDLFKSYLRSPWAIMSVTAAILIFVLSLIQTIYTVLSYVNPKKQHKLVSSCVKQVSNHETKLWHVVQAF